MRSPWKRITAGLLTFPQVYGGPDMSAPRLTRLCTTMSSPMSVSSTGNLLTVRFKSDAYVSGRGFNASWAEVQGGRWALLHCTLYMHRYYNFLLYYTTWGKVRRSFIIEVKHLRRNFHISDKKRQLQTMCRLLVVNNRTKAAVTQMAMWNECTAIIRYNVITTNTTDLRILAYIDIHQLQIINQLSSFLQAVEVQS